MSHFFRILLCFLLVLLMLPAMPSGALQAMSGLATDTSSLLLLPATEVSAVAPPMTSASSFALLDPMSGELLAQQDADTRRPMASTTKIMTALLVLELCDPKETVRVPAEAVGVEGSSIYLYKDERITVETLLYGLMLSSANDAATALAIHAAGSVAEFAALMNQKAVLLGLTSTHFCNPHGLHEAEHYTTARDLAKLTAAALKNPTFAEIVSTKRYSALQSDTDASRLFLNHNRLLRSFEGAIGVKTGYTKTSGRCLVSAAARDGLTLIAVTLNAPNDWRDHTALLEWGFSQYVAFAPRLDPLTLPVVGGQSGTVELLPEKALALTLPAGHPEITCTVEAPRFLYAGFEQGKSVGRIIYRMGDTVLGEISLITAKGVSTLPKPSFKERIKSLFAR